MTDFFQRNKKLILHTSFWSVYASLFFYTIGFGKDGEANWGRIMSDGSFHVLSLLGISYLNYFYFLPRLIRDQAVGRYLLTFGPLFVVFSYFFLWGKELILGYYFPGSDWMYSPRFAANVITSAFFATVCVGLLRFVEDYFELEARRKELENQQLTSELQFLKAQINPHFLFNTLNNLYYLAINESSRTPEVIAKLSGMMRYMLYDSNHPLVPLAREIEYIENYLSLERLRLDDRVPITFEVAGEVEGVRIAPLILITFLENAFKHGVSGSAEGDVFITVRLDVEAGSCHYRVTNSKLAAGSKTLNEKSGIGLQNVRRRLELSYPDRYRLHTDETEDRYRVDLQLQLA
ncbi:sensor histidine kinase [Neolewinella sp.]|uniref:sensor histidine kinase n=1 Tax=Neolewinella sp. TaxID=2993543 RepID=UPI003B51941E